ncbi:hypothetical protein SAY86_022619 [Trapa natans]|uniref:HMA domain-containing protein n=1 Tax=Trapa natans TaxID=22666 RepID=A0AAN7R4M4_TRANT|nr:hypothetical protein SAY86_022619 [Trapa natans]
MGILDYLSGICECTPHSSKKKLKQLQTVEIKVKMDCEGCERRVRKAVEGMNGVSQVEVNPKQSKLTVVGYVDPKKVLHQLRHGTGKEAQFWPYVPYDFVDHPYAPGAYDKKAPAGYVRDVLLQNPQAYALAQAGPFEVKYTSAFSDENANACTVM